MPLTSPVHTTPHSVPGGRFTFKENVGDAVDVNLASLWPGPITDLWRLDFILEHAIVLSGESALNLSKQFFLKCF